MESGAVDAVVIATPTMSHAPIASAALAAGLHVMLEKPVARSVGEARRVLASARPDTICAVMLNQRTHPDFRAIKQAIDDGSIGALRRVNWTMTQWYRPNIYYETSAWRGTWIGEGGGVLLNQAIHNLDILQWLVGMAVSVLATAALGKYHPVEVEDEVTAVLDFASVQGVIPTGTVIASTGESPGVNQLDIIGDLGMIRFDGHTIALTRNTPATSEHCRTTNEMFGSPATERLIVTPGPQVDQHAVLLTNFVDAILDGDPLIAPASEGLHSLEFANAILQSSWSNERVSLPIDPEAYDSLLDERIRASQLRKPSDREVSIDMNKSYR